jgi:hypothetical protein
MRAAVFILVLLLTGCSTTPTPDEATSVSSPRDKAAITIKRSSSIMYFGAAATVTLNGAQIANLSVGQSYSGVIAPGEATITVSAWSAPGSSSYRFTAEAGKTYTFFVGPRGEPMVAGMTAGVVGQAIESGGPFSIFPTR